MIFSPDENFIISFGILVGLALILNFLSVNNTKGFVVFLAFISGFLVYSGILDLWVLILTIIISLVIVVNEFSPKNGLIMLPLIVILFLTIFSLIFGATFVSIIVENFVSNDLIIDGVTSVLELSGESIIFDIDPLIGATTWIIVIIILVSVLGINIIGSGLSDESIRTITIGTFYGSVWIILSLYASPLIISIAIYGLLIYVTFTISFALGVGKLISRGG